MKEISNKNATGAGMRRGRSWCLASVLLVTFAQLALKWGMVHLPALPDMAEMTGMTFSLASALSSKLLQLTLQNPQPFLMIFFGLSAYAISMLCWFFALRYLTLSYAYPMISLSYALVYILAATLPWFDESSTLPKTIGVLLILLGVWLLNSKGKESKGKKIYLTR